jgi:hypothetical protein
MRNQAMSMLLVSLLLLLVAVALLAVVLSDVLLQGLATMVRGAALEPRQLLTVRKIGYVVVVVYLFTWAFLWRRTVVDATAAEAAVREESRGDVHLNGALIRLSLGGFRGVTTCYLWNLAMDKQMKNQLNELEVVVGWLTELQPHFNTPWLFQSWNLAYNVSNKTDRISDKYFYITRGIRLLADGERQNRNDPDLRFEMATTYQHKICQSDETNYHRSLFQLSLIPPNERDPARFRPEPGGRGKINMNAFREFCQDHPQLIRRLREGIHKDSLYEQRRLFSCPTPAAVVQFLADNYRVPSLYPEAKPTPPGVEWVANKDVKPDENTLHRFPVLPPHRTQPTPGQHFFELYSSDDPKNPVLDRDDESPYNEVVDAWDGYVAARAWYSYAVEPLPDPAELPGDNRPVTDRVHQHLNRHMQTIIFRQYPARAQSYIAERLEEEGWFDGEGWSPKSLEWFKDYIGGGTEWATNAWAEAFRMWQAHGQRNHILLPESELKSLEDQQTYYIDRAKTGQLTAAEAADPQIQAGIKAAQFLAAYNANRGVSNFPNNFNRANVEQDPKVVRARKLFYEAEALAATGSTFLALRMYQDPDPDPNPVKVLKFKGADGQPVVLSALDAWAALLEANPDFRHDEFIQEQTYETELSYLDVVNRAMPGNEIKAQLGAISMVGAPWFHAAGLQEAWRPDRAPPLTVTKGLFDLKEEADGSPWINPRVMKSVIERRRLYQPRRRDADQPPTPPQVSPQQPGVGPSGETPGPVKP